MKNEIDVNTFLPYTSGVLSGTVESQPVVTKGGHVLFTIISKKKKIHCAVYKPTKITDIAKELIVGDKIKVGGGIRKATKNLPRTLNIEIIEILKLEKKIKSVNPLCHKCKKRMKSKGKNQGYQCIRCKNIAYEKIVQLIPRSIKKQLYVPDVSAHRHLTKPLQRMNLKNKTEKFDPNSKWFSNF